VAFDRAPGERLSRYIVERNRIRPSNQTVKYIAFMPPPNRRLSVYKTTGLVENEVWQLGHDYIAPILQKPILARADVNSVVAYAEGLAVEMAPSPHPRHANIMGWDMNSTRTRLQAISLAAAAKLVMLLSPRGEL